MAPEEARIRAEKLYAVSRIQRPQFNGRGVAGEQVIRDATADELRDRRAEWRQRRGDQEDTCTPFAHRARSYVKRAMVTCPVCPLWSIVSQRRSRTRSA